MDAWLTEPRSRWWRDFGDVDMRVEVFHTIGACCALTCYGTTIAAAP